MLSKKLAGNVMSFVTSSEVNASALTRVREAGVVGVGVMSGPVRPQLPRRLAK
jgi:hypothetical protein